MRFLVDAQLPPSLAHWLVEQGHVAEHVADHNLEAASDRAIWDFADAVSAVIVTKDEDFALRRGGGYERSEGRLDTHSDVRRRALLGWFEQVLPDILSALDRGEPLIEVV